MDVPDLPGNISFVVKSVLALIFFISQFTTFVLTNENVFITLKRLKQ
jgi:hypothetical protein